MTIEPVTAPQYATFYDPNAESEKLVPLPSAPLRALSLAGLSLQPPLSRRGTGPGLIVFLPPTSDLAPHEAQGLEQPLDPEPVYKWAEEGYGVVAVSDELTTEGAIREALEAAIEALVGHESIDIKDKIGVLVYNPSIIDTLLSVITSFPILSALIIHGSSASSSPLPTMSHIPTIPNPHAPSTTITSKPAAFESVTHVYPISAPHFIVPSSGPASYSPSNANVAHTRSLVFLRKHIGGPFFDLEPIWDEHTFFEFVDRSVAKTMGTMVAEPYVNHVPTMTGGIGRKALGEFYRDHFIFANPSSTELSVVSRTVGPDRVVDEFVFNCIHDQEIDWLMPGVPPLGKQLRIPMIAVVNVRGDRLYHEHIWWDNATALQQAGYLPNYVPNPSDSSSKVRLPVDGYASARMLLDETDGTSNEMFTDSWGVQKP